MLHLMISLGRCRRILRVVLRPSESTPRLTTPAIAFLIALTGLSTAGYAQDRATFTVGNATAARGQKATGTIDVPAGSRSEEHTSELQSRLHLVCRLLLEK